MAEKDTEIRYLTPPSVDTKKKKYCRFKKSGIKYRRAASSTSTTKIPSS